MVQEAENLKEWIELQLKLQRKLQRELKQSQVFEDSLNQYAKIFHRDFKKMQRVEPPSFYRALLKTDVLFIGDFHSLGQSQKFLLRLLRDKNLRKPEFLGLEALDSKDEKILHRLLLNPKSLTEDMIKKLLPIDDWGSSWQNYREIFLECHKNSIKIKGLKAEKKSLKQRDEEAAMRISQFSGPSWIFFGEFHCARPHLPMCLRTLNSKKKIVVLQQNEDRLLEQHLQEISSHRRLYFQSKSSSSIDLFCALHTPAWVKWQSYLDQQNRIEGDESPISAQEQIHWSLETLWSFLKDPRYLSSRSLDDLLDVNVIAIHDEDFDLSVKSLPSSKRKEFLRSIEFTRTASFSNERKIFISETSINSCAQAAAAYLYQSWSGQGLIYRNFLQSALTESICFFLTKILNHSRKTKPWHELRSLDKDLAKAVSRGRNSISVFSTKKDFLLSQRKEWIAGGIQLGRILADLLFEAFLAGEFSKARLNRFLTQAPKNDREILERLIEIQSIGKSFERPIRN